LNENKWEGHCDLYTIKERQAKMSADTLTRAQVIQGLAEILESTTLTVTDIARLVS
jgi:hypothetical protein